jgi:hypothetical protein
MDKMQMGDKTTGQSQLDKFKEAARELETDDDPRHFKEKLAKVVKHKTGPENGDGPSS